MICGSTGSQTKESSRSTIPRRAARERRSVYKQTNGGKINFLEGSKEALTPAEGQPSSATVSVNGYPSWVDCPRFIVIFVGVGMARIRSSLKPLEVERTMLDPRQCRQHPGFGPTKAR